MIGQDFVEDVGNGSALECPRDGRLHLGVGLHQHRRIPKPTTDSASDEWVLFAAYPHQPGYGRCDWFAAEAVPVLETALETRVATWRTEPAPNTYPALPVRGDHALVWMATFVDAAPGAIKASL